MTTLANPYAADHTGAPAAAPAHDRHAPTQGLGALTLAAVGVVYGDIGTSPLYTLAEIFSPTGGGVALDAAHITGAVSTIFWALMLVVTLKYVVLILRADNHGEGGGLALTALAAQAIGNRPGLRAGLLLLGMAGATLFYGDSVITPAISVLGAVEGLKVLTPALDRWVLPLSIVVLLGLFAVQRHGTAVVGRWFGPVIVLWFGTLAVTGVVQILRQPAILAALDPRAAWGFLADLHGRGAHLLPALGAIVLALTGAEALYADMGHFGRKPIQLAWCGLVLPALALNYLGQGALLMSDAKAIENPFFNLFPAPLVLPAVLLATLAAVIASQAVISGAYSMTRQAIQLGFLPRMVVRHTSAAAAGQIYLPAVNTLLLLGVLGVTLGFRSASALAGAYGIAVTLTMAITTIMTWFVVRQGWRLPLAVVGPATLVFLTLDLLLVAGCAIKFLDGGWFPLAVGALLWLLMTTWAHGRRRLIARLQEDGLALADFVSTLSDDALPRVARTAIYPVADPGSVPQALLHNLKHNQVLHQRNIVLTVVFDPRPWVPAAERLVHEDLGHGFERVRLHFGFMDTPDVPQALAGAPALAIEPMATSWFLSRETLLPAAGLGHWRERLFTAMARTAGSATQYFRLPDNAVVELGTRIQL